MKITFSHVNSILKIKCRAHWPQTINSKTKSKNKKQTNKQIYLYSGIPVVSLNHSTNFTESWIVGGVMSQGSSASLSKAAHTTLAGTENKKNK